EFLSNFCFSSPSKTSIKALLVFRKDLLIIRGTRESKSNSMTTKSAKKWNVPTLTKTSSATPTGREIKRSASSRVIHIGDSSGRESLFHTDNGMRFLFVPRSARVKHSSILEKSHGMRNLPGSPSFYDGYGTEGFWLGFRVLTEATTGSMMGAITGSEFDGYGIEGFWLGFEALTGAATCSEFGIEVSTWTTRGWTSLVRPLLAGGTVSFVTLVSRSTTLGREKEVVGIVGP
nr:hypothetical protein [Tanacetum cinerariifolium]